MRHLVAAEEDEPQEFDWARLSELERRNTLCLPHMRSCYPAEEAPGGAATGVTATGVVRGPTTRAAAHTLASHELASPSKRRRKVGLTHRHIALTLTASLGRVHYDCPRKNSFIRTFINAIIFSFVRSSLIHLCPLFVMVARYLTMSATLVLHTDSNNYL